MIPVRKVIDRCYPDMRILLQSLSAVRELPCICPEFAGSRSKRRTVLFQAHRDRSRSSAPQNVIRTSTFAISLRTATSGQVLAIKPDRTSHHSENSSPKTTQRKQVPLAIRLRYGGFSYFSGGDGRHEQKYGDGLGEISRPRSLERPGRSRSPLRIIMDSRTHCGAEWVRALQPKRL